jgi:hypothetical protein
VLATLGDDLQYFLGVKQAAEKIKRLIENQENKETEE